MTNKELLKAYAAYLPYGVKIEQGGYRKQIADLIGMVSETISTQERVTFKDEDGDIYNGYFYESKLILRPLSDLTKEIEHNGEKFVPVEFLNSELITIDYFEDTDHYEYLMSWINSVDKSHHINFLPFGLIQKLLEWHFDIFNLREKDCCIYYN